MSATDGVRWVKVPRGRRTKSQSGIESLVGRAGSGVDPDTAEGSHEFVGEPPVEIESLIIPAIQEMHDDMVARTRNGTQKE